MRSSLREDSFLYHATGIDNLSGIMTNGIRPSDALDYLDEELLRVASEHGIPSPIDRRKCVFFYPTFVRPFKTRTFDKTELRQTLNSRSVIIIVDADQIDRELYIGEFTLFTNAIRLWHKSNDGRCEDVLRQYAGSLTRVLTLDDLPELCRQFHDPEIVVEGTVPPAAIDACVLDDQYFTRLL